MVVLFPSVTIMSRTDIVGHNLSRSVCGDQFVPPTQLALSYLHEGHRVWEPKSSWYKPVLLPLTPTSCLLLGLCFSAPPFPSVLKSLVASPTECGWRLNIILYLHERFVCLEMLTTLYLHASSNFWQACSPSCPL